MRTLLSRNCSMNCGAAGRERTPLGLSSACRVLPPTCPQPSTRAGGPFVCPTCPPVALCPTCPPPPRAHLCVPNVDRVVPLPPKPVAVVVCILGVELVPAGAGSGGGGAAAKRAAQRRRSWTGAGACCTPTWHSFRAVDVPCLRCSVNYSSNRGSMQRGGAPSACLWQSLTASATRRRTCKS